MQKAFILLFLTFLTSIQPVFAQKAKHNFSGFRFGGRLRMNSFYYDRTGKLSDYPENQLQHYTKDDKLYDPRGLGAGVGIIASTPDFFGLSITAGYYTSNSLGLLTDDDAKYGKSGKDTFYNKRNPDGTKSNSIHSIAVFAQLFLKYQYKGTEIKTGRFKFIHQLDI